MTCAQVSGKKDRERRLQIAFIDVYRMLAKFIIDLTLLRKEAFLWAIVYSKSCDRYINFSWGTKCGNAEANTFIFNQVYRGFLVEIGVILERILEGCVGR